LSSANTYTGTTTISTGTLAVSGGLSNSTQVSVANGAVYRLDVNDTVGSIEGAGSITTGAASGTVTLTANMASSSLIKTFSGVISDGTSASLALVKSGAGKLTLTNANTYTGGTTLTAGNLTLGSSERLSNAGVLSISGGTFALGSFNQTVSSLNITGGQVTGNGTLTSSSYVINTPLDDITTLDTLITGATQINKTGAGLLILTGNNSYTGGTVLTGGTLNLGSTNAIGSTGLINFAGGTLQFSDANTTDYSARFSTTDAFSSARTVS
jgi:autotransporter-associated beta strand protein